jgi:hypothetical protein
MSGLRKLRRGARAIPGSKLYHYTTVKHLERIVADGMILAARAHVPEGEIPAVWCSSHPFWEVTANKSLVARDTGKLVELDRLGTLKAVGGLARIEVSQEAAPHDWREYLQLSKVNPEEARRLARIGELQGSGPAFWRVSFEPITGDEWLGIEVDCGNGWQTAGERA